MSSPALSDEDGSIFNLRVLVSCRYTRMCAVASLVSFFSAILLDRCADAPPVRRGAATAIPGLVARTPLPCRRGYV